jgi:type III secretion protein N (ATPase)
LGTCALGRAIDSMGEPLDDEPALAGPRVAVALRWPRPNERAAIDRPSWTGVRAIDALLTLGRGARIGIFGAPGCGKTTLLESIVDGCAADAVVVALVGERGREAQHWLARRNERTTVICATSDRQAGERVAAAHVAFAQAVALRRRGLHVLLVLDSLARTAAALREIAVGRGESIGRGGYPPSVFGEMARIVEIGGALSSGSITLVATVLSDGDERDPVSDAARSLLDGHIALSAQLAHAGHFPAIDVLQSTSRTMERVTDETHRRRAQRLRRALAVLKESEDARALGITPQGEELRAAIAVERPIEAFLCQGHEWADARTTLAQLAELVEQLEAAHGDR